MNFPESTIAEPIIRANQSNGEIAQNIPEILEAAKRMFAKSQFHQNFVCVPSIYGTLMVRPDGKIMFD